MKKLNIGIVGVTGLVGQKILEILETYDLEIKHLYVFASSRSAGSTVQFRKKTYTILELTEQSFDFDLDIVFMALDNKFAVKYVPIAVSKGIYVVDNSSAFRMDEAVPLVVPEVNLDVLKKENLLIANPNCSTIQSVVALKVVDDLFDVKSVSYTTYQAVSGSGLLGIEDLNRGKNGEAPNFYPKPIYENVIPHIDAFLDNGYTKEEMKMITETNKILNKNLDINATCVRVPVQNGHSVSMVIETYKDIDLDLLKTYFKENDAIVYFDHDHYPTPLEVVGQDKVYVGRLRMDLNHPNKVLLWTVADNVRKGAATNAIQIAKYVSEEFIK